MATTSMVATKTLEDLWSHSTSINRSRDLLAREAALAQSARWTDTHGPRVTNPTISSRGPGCSRRQPHHQVVEALDVHTTAEPRPGRAAVGWRRAVMGAAPRRPHRADRGARAGQPPAPRSVVTDGRVHGVEVGVVHGGGQLGKERSEASSAPVALAAELLDQLLAAELDGVLAALRENHWRIFVRARDEATIPSQSRDGPAVGAFEVKISTASAELSLVSRGTSRPFTLAPMQR